MNFNKVFFIDPFFQISNFSVSLVSGKCYIFGFSFSLLGNNLLKFLISCFFSVEDITSVHYLNSTQITFLTLVK